MPRPNRGAYLKFIRARGSFYIQWSEQGRTLKRSTGTADRQEAESQLADFIRDRQRRQRPDGPRDPRHFSIADALDLYGSEHAPTTAAPVRIGCAIEALLPFWGDKMVADINAATCREYCLKRQRSPGTLRRELGTLSAAINYAHRHGRIATAPFVFRPAKPEGRSRWLTRDEAARLLHAALRSRVDSRLYLPLFIVLALYTGARKEALLSLRWPQVDLERGRLDLNPVGRKRTAKGRAILPIPKRLLTFVRLAHGRRSSDLGFVIHDKGRQIKDIGGAWNGDPEQRTIQGSFGRACKRANLPHVSPHTLRHTCGTWMAQQGVDLWEIAGWLGQTHARTTELYAHHHPDHLRGAMQALDRRRA
jgi:integrase